MPISGPSRFTQRDCRPPRLAVKPLVLTLALAALVSTSVAQETPSPHFGSLSGAPGADCRLEPAAPPGETAGSPDQGPTLTDRLADCNGVIAPPAVGDRDLVVPPPQVGEMPIITPGDLPPTQPPGD